MYLLIDKPKGITSHDVVHRLRKITGEKRIGHAGTLDPNATGLLIVAIGRESTKTLGSLTKDTKKTYEAHIVLGQERDTDDVEGNVTSKSDVKPEENEIFSVLKSFIGEIEQIPPMYSAIKVSGKKLYELARIGQKIELKPRRVQIYSINHEDYYYPDLKIVCEVSSGTYIRSLARDIGVSLKTGAYLKNLRRTAIGEYNIKQAVALDVLTPQNWKEHCI